MVADCPCHGNKYHTYHDTYPDGDPEGRVIEDYITKLAKLEVDLYAIKIMDDTDKMYTILSECYYNTRGENIKISKLGHSTNDFAGFVSSSAT